jgi:hypothetical protein
MTLLDDNGVKLMSFCGDVYLVSHKAKEEVENVHLSQAPSIELSPLLIF